MEKSNGTRRYPPRPGKGRGARQTAIGRGTNAVESVEYEERVKAQVDQYVGVEEIHDLPESFHYWSNKHLRPMMAEVLGLETVTEFYGRHLADAIRASDAKTVVSLGSGDCTTEVEIAEWMIEQGGVSDFTFECLELSPHLIDRAVARISEQGLSNFFLHTSCDINKWEPAGKVAGVMAAHALHHFVELEWIFDRIRDALTDEGVFVTHDMIGRNGHMRWPEALEIVEGLWNVVPEKYRFNPLTQRVDEEYFNMNCAEDGFEGIRAQDILPLLVERFEFEKFLGFSGLQDVFLSRQHGHNLDPKNPHDTMFIDFLDRLNNILIDAGYLKPTQMFAVMKRRAAERRCWRHWTPEFCVRGPGIDFEKHWAELARRGNGA